ncbi:BlaI family penicillinase repressor [Dysgonomonas sp. PH5-45]|nr:BlaI/MecI/CopY family transcriptional regulator [Dysgonomonas sp. PH5-45]MDH6354111.1 BlaI family penicillinase repressor [Dysgonomonas sp. PH5-45]
MQLTKAEEQIMQILWKLGEGSVQDIRESFTDTKPARTTIATILNILETKQFVTHTSEKRVNRYKATVSKETYSKKQLFGFMKNYFGGSFSTMASFFAKESNMTIEDLDQLFEETRQALEEEKNKPE